MLSLTPHEGRGDDLSHIIGNGGANMVEDPNMKECRLADGTNVLVTVKSVIENLYMMGQRD